MSWSVSEFTAASVVAAQKEIERQVRCNEREPVLNLLNAALEMCGVHPDMLIKVRAYGHKNHNAPGGNVFIEICPHVKPVE